MDYTKAVDLNDTRELQEFLSDGLNVSIPLYYNNPNRSVRINLENLCDDFAGSLVKTIVSSLLQGKNFWICQYGSTSGYELLSKGFLMGSPPISIIEHDFSSINSEWYEYPSNHIACVKIPFQSFNMDAYITYVFRRCFLSNTLFLIDTIGKCAISIYDRRGMDIASADDTTIERIRTDFGKYVMLGSSIN